MAGCIFKKSSFLSAVDLQIPDFAMFDLNKVFRYNQQRFSAGGALRREDRVASGDSNGPRRPSLVTDRDLNRPISDQTYLHLDPLLTSRVRRRSENGATTLHENSASRL